MVRTKISKLWLLFVVSMLALQAAYIDIFFIEPNWIQQERIRIINPKLSKALGGLTVIHLSDFHIETLGFVEVSLIGMVERLKPDLILITGDVAEFRQSVQPAVDILSLFEPAFRTYMVLGETQGDSAISEIADSPLWDEARVTVLQNKAVRLNIKNEDDSYFWLVNPSAPELLPALIKDVPKEEPIIVLYHFPEVIKRAAVEKADLVLAGNTHGGQCGIALLRRFFPYAARSAYIAGLFKVKEALLYVNRGISSQKGMRFFCRPELTVLEFASEGKMTKPKVLKQDESY